jgi:hypothetical protein
MEKQFLSKAKTNFIDISEVIHAGSYFTIRLFMEFSIDSKENNVDEGKIISQQFFFS